MLLHSTSSRKKSDTYRPNHAFIGLSKQTCHSTDQYFVIRAFSIIIVSFFFFILKTPIMSDIFEHREKVFMKFPLETCKLHREIYAVELRKKKRLSSFDQKRKSNGGNPDGLLVKNDRFRALFEKILKNATASSNESCKKLSYLAGNEKGMFLEKLKICIKFSIEMLDSEDFTMVSETVEFYFLISTSGYQSLLIDHHVYLNLLNVLELAIDDLDAYALATLVNLNEGFPNIGAELLDSGYLDMLESIWLNAPENSEIVSLALKTVTKSSIKGTSKHVKSLIPQITYLKTLHNE